MATDDQVAAVKNAGLPSGENQAALGVVWDDEQIGLMFDLFGTVSKTVRGYWNAVLANTAMYMDITESGSTRQLSQPWKNAWEMVQRWDKLVAEEDAKEIRNVTGSVTFGHIKRV